MRDRSWVWPAGTDGRWWLNGRYIGTRPELLGKKAMMVADANELCVKPAPLTPFALGDMVFVQFDDLNVPEAYGWHTFLRTDFEVVA